MTVLEARTLCSGATERNRGNLLTPSGLLYDDLREAYGNAMAIKLISVIHSVISETIKVVYEYAPNDFQVRSVTQVYAYRDVETFEQAKASVANFESADPKHKGFHTTLSEEEVKKVGALVMSFKNIQIPRQT